MDSSLLHPPPRRRGLGVVYEPHDPRTQRWPAADLIGAAPSNPIPLVEHAYLPGGDWQDQRWTESCVSFAIMQAVWIRQAVLGVPVRDRIAPSCRDIYYRARASRHGWDAIADIGSNPVAGWEVLRPPERGGAGIGIVLDDDLPFDPHLVDSPPDPAVYRPAIERDWLSYWWILDDDEERCRHVDGLLRTGHPVAAAITCDAAIKTWDPSTGPWRYRGPRVGGHYVLLVWVDDDGDYWALGSWGDGYGVGGLHHIAREEIASSRTSYLSTPEIDLEKRRRTR